MWPEENPEREGNKTVTLQRSQRPYGLRVRRNHTGRFGNIAIPFHIPRCMPRHTHDHYEYISSRRMITCPQEELQYFTVRLDAKRVFLLPLIENFISYYENRLDL